MCVCVYVQWRLAPSARGGLLRRARSHAYQSVNGSIALASDARCVHVCLYLRVYFHVCVQTFQYVCVFQCVSVCVYMCMHVEAY